MGNKITLLISLLFCSSCASSVNRSVQIDNEIKYAVAFCLASAYPDSQYSNDAKYISGAYIQKGNYGLDTYENIRTFVTHYRRNKYVSKHDKNLDIMQCLDLYSSNDLKAEIKNLADK